MRIAQTVSTVVLAAVLLAARPASALDIGDQAPPLSISEWVKGKPIELPRDAKKKIHVVEFWATWCPPCKMSVPLLTDLQQKYKDDVVIVGVTEPDQRGNTPSAIRRFVEERGSEMAYTVAIDDGRTATAYMAASGAVGIPQAFVIARDATVVWQGSPLDPALGEVLGKLVEGKYDVEAAKIEQEVNQRLEQLDMLSRLGQWTRVWEGLVEIMRIDPDNELGMDILMRLSTRELRNFDALHEWAEGHIKAHRHDAAAMMRLADMLCRIDDLSARSPELALEAARAAYEASGQRDAAAIAIYAMALYQIGELDRAIALQQDAVAVASGPNRDTVREALEYYRTCKKLQETLK